MKVFKEESDKNLNVTPYKSLKYLVATRSYISFGVRILSIFMEEPKESHWATTKKILRYVKVIGHEMLRIEKTHQDMPSILVLLYIIGLQRITKL
nr:Retrovirus-related Pol polyprotein from transposon TNT 1-94 [Ipomoea batatas]